MVLKLLLNNLKTLFESHIFLITVLYEFGNFFRNTKKRDRIYLISIISRLCETMALTFSVPPRELNQIFCSFFRKFFTKLFFAISEIGINCSSDFAKCSSLFILLRKGIQAKTINKRQSSNPAVRTIISLFFSLPIT